jgi:hypothetical protein
LFQKFVLQGEFAHQAFQFLNPVIEGGFLDGFVVEFPQAVLPLPIVKETR